MENIMQKNYPEHFPLGTYLIQYKWAENDCA